MSKKKTREEYVDELTEKNPNLELIGEYINSNTPTLHRCLIHDITWSTTPSRALKGVGCKKCHQEKIDQKKRKTHEQYVNEITIINPDIFIIGKYVDAKTKIDVYCKRHNVSWSAYPDNLRRGCGCSECMKEKIGDKNRKSHEQYLTELNVVNSNIEVVANYIDALTPILHQCKTCGHIWPASPGNILFGKGCPKCKESHGEKQIYDYLVDHNISFIPQKCFSDCRDQRPLPFDFYLLDNNILIEYDGEQHFRPVNFGGISDEEALENFKITQCHDEIKNQYCKNNNIRLLRIPYYKSVEEELENFLFI